MDTKSILIFISDNQNSIYNLKQWSYNHGYQVKIFTSSQWKNGISNPKFLEPFGGTKSPQPLSTGQVLPFPLKNQQKQPRQKASVPTIREMQRRVIKETIDKFQGNLTKTSVALGIGRATLYRKVKQYNIDLSHMRKKKALKAA